MSRRSDEVTVPAWQPWSASHVALPQSPSRPRWPSTPRPRRSKPQVRTSSASARASPTSRRPTRSSRPPPPPATTRRTIATRRRAACPSCERRSSRSPSATRASTCTESQVLVTNGGKQALYNTFATLLDPGDEVLLPAPYWTTYPESITLGGGVPVVVPTTVAAGFRVTLDQLEAARHAAHQGAGVRVAVEPERRRLPAGRGRSDRALGGREGHLGRHRRDLRAPHVRRARVLVDAGARARARRSVRRRQRRREDLRDDRLARRLDDRPERRRQGRDEPAEPQHVERRRRLAARRRRGAERRPRARSR